MAEGMSFSFPSLLFHEGRTYGPPERRIPCRLLCAGHSYAEGVPAMLLFLKLKAMLPEIYAGYVRKEESRHGDFSLHNQNSRTK